jgi:very-short-patch-repair endonuclease
MNADVSQPVTNEATRVIECAYRVSNTLGAGFLEKVYRQEVVGEYIPDFVVADSIVVEIKALDALNRIHHARCMNYLRTTGLSVGLLLNFGTPRLEIKRLVWRF